MGASLFAGLAAPLEAQVTTRVSVGSGGAQGNQFSLLSSISADGRFAAFQSAASNLVPGDTNGSYDVFVRDQIAGATERVSVDSSGVQGDNDSSAPSISADGRYVAFWSMASNLVAGDTNGTWDVFVRDRTAGTTERVSLDSSGAQANGPSYGPAISADGRWVAFQSFASNLVPGDANGLYDVFVRDRLAGATERVSVDSAGAEANDESSSPAISADGRYVAFHASATNLVSGDTNGATDVFVRDRVAGTTERASVGSGGAQGNGDAFYPSITADGRYVAFESAADALVAADTNGVPDVFVRDRMAGTTERASLGMGAVQGNGASRDPSITADGRYVAFGSESTNLVGGDTNDRFDVFVRDRIAGTTERASVSTSGEQADDLSELAAMAAGGRFLAFASFATNLVPADTNLQSDIFVRDLDATGFMSLCDPGADGVIGCPCSNPPGGPGRGCDNSSATGGATLAADGVAYLSMDSLVFTTGGEKPSALSIVTQWAGPDATGDVFGMGVRCTSGTFRRLYTTAAVGGSITAPDFGAGDPPVSERSASLGDTILAGQSRWYFVYYRDPVVLGGCPGTSTFNATTTGQVTWSP